MEECAGFPNAAYDDQVDALTQALNRLRDVSRAIYTVPESEILVDTRAIPSDWPRAFAMDVRWHETAALWGALDPQSKILYVYSEYYQSNVEPAIHAQGIRARGKWIPGLLEVTANSRSHSDGWKLLRIYQELGLKMGTVADSEQSGVCEVWQRMRSGRLKVFRTLENFFREYRLYRRDAQGHVVKQNDPLMNCLRYLCVSGPERMQTELNPRQDLYRSTLLPGTPDGWMAL